MTWRLFKMLTWLEHIFIFLFCLVLLSHTNYIPITPCSVNNEMSIKVKTCVFIEFIDVQISFINQCCYFKKCCPIRHLTTTLLIKATDCNQDSSLCVKNNYLIIFHIQLQCLVLVCIDRHNYCWELGNHKCSPRTEIMSKTWT